MRMDVCGMALPLLRQHNSNLDCLWYELIVLCFFFPSFFCFVLVLCKKRKADRGNRMNEEEMIGQEKGKGKERIRKRRRVKGVM